MVSAAHGNRGARQIPVAFALVFLAVALLWLRPGAAQDQGAEFSATVKVDATAADAAKARNRARLDGQRRALAEVVERLSGAAEAPQVAKLGDAAITDIVESFEVAKERMSAVRYLADYTFHFRPDAVRRLVGNAAATPAVPAGGGKAIIVVPVYRDGARNVLWDDPNPWREAFAHLPAAGGAAALTVPLGDLGDVAAIGARRAAAGDPTALAGIAARNGGGDVVVALATARHQGSAVAGLDVAVKRYAAGRLADSRQLSFDAAPDEKSGALYARAAAAVAASLAGAATAGEGAAASLSAVVPIADLGDWVAVRRRLGSLSVIRDVDLLSLSRREAHIAIRYFGSQEALKTSLAGVDLALSGSDPEWRIERAGVAGGPPGPPAER